MPGVFHITIINNLVNKQLNKTNATAQKIIKELIEQKMFDIYSQTLNSVELPIIGKFIKRVLSIERNGNYTMDLIKGYNLMDLLEKNNELCKIAKWNSKELKLDKSTCTDILIAIIELEIALYSYGKIYKLRGDWFLHNLIYEVTTNRIYNVDLEGFYSYYGESPMCDLKVYIPHQFNTCKKELLNQTKSNIFSIILWNPVSNYYPEIREKIKQEFNIILDKKHNINNMKKFIDKIYELDVRCHRPYLPRKIEILNKYEPSVQFLLILIDKPNYDNQKVSQSAVKLKEVIRSEYKSKIENYYKDIIIHVSDNSKEAECIYRYLL